VDFLFYWYVLRIEKMRVSVSALAIHLKFRGFRFLSLLSLLLRLPHHYIVDFWMFQSHVLPHGSLSAIGLPALSHLTDVLPLDLIRTPAYSSLLVISIVLGVVFEGGDQVC
jgi:hypothetical protein